MDCLGFQCFTQELDRLFLLLALIFTICRFVHGASIHLDVPSNKRYKPLVDFVGFFFQASCFYLMALTLDKPITFSILFAIMLLADAIWLIVLLAIKYIEELSATVVKQWLWSDFLIVVLLIILCVIQTKVVHWVEFIILLIALVAAALDYLLNKNFYFPSSIPNQHG